MKIYSGVFLVLAMFFVNVAEAEQRSYVSFELLSLQIKLSQDGTGIIKGLTCESCGFKIAKISARTKVFVNGVRVDVSHAASRAGKSVYIEVDDKTADVLAIYCPE